MSTIVINDVFLERNNIDDIYDLEIDGADLRAAINLRTAIIISLFSDGRSLESDIIPNSRGWAGDSIKLQDETNIGSRLWLLFQRKTTDDLLPEIEGFVIDSLQWLLNRNIAEEVIVDAQFLSKPLGVVTIHIQVFEKQGNVIQEFTYAWDQLRQTVA